MRTKKKEPPDEQGLYADFAEAFRLFEQHPTDLARARVIRDFTRWSLAFSPQSSAADVMVLRSRLKVER